MGEGVCYDRRRRLMLSDRILEILEELLSKVDWERIEAEREARKNG